MMWAGRFYLGPVGTALVAVRIGLGQGQALSLQKIFHPTVAYVV